MAEQDNILQNFISWTHKTFSAFDLVRNDELQAPYPIRVEAEDGHSEVNKNDVFIVLGTKTFERFFVEPSKYLPITCDKCLVKPSDPNNIYLTVEKLFNDFPKYAQIESVLEAKSLTDPEKTVILRKGERVELIRTSNGSEVARCLRRRSKDGDQDEDIIIPASCRGSFKWGDDKKMYSLVEVLQTYKLPLRIHLPGSDEEIELTQSVIDNKKKRKFLIACKVSISSGNRLGVKHLLFIPLNELDENAIRFSLGQECTKLQSHSQCYEFLIKHSRKIKMNNIHEPHKLLYDDAYARINDTIPSLFGSRNSAYFENLTADCEWWKRECSLRPTINIKVNSPENEPNSEIVVKRKSRIKRFFHGLRKTKMEESVKMKESDSSNQSEKPSDNNRRNQIISQPIIIEAEIDPHKSEDYASILDSQRSLSALDMNSTLPYTDTHLSEEPEQLSPTSRCSFDIEQAADLMLSLKPIDYATETSVTFKPRGQSISKTTYDSIDEADATDFLLSLRPLNNIYE